MEPFGRLRAAWITAKQLGALAGPAQLAGPAGAGCLESLAGLGEAACLESLAGLTGLAHLSGLTDLSLNAAISVSILT